MAECIQTYNVPKKERDIENTILSLRLTPAEAERFWRVMDAAKARSPYAGKSDVVRELLGLAPPQVLTADDMVFFQTGGKGIPVAAKSKQKMPLHRHAPDLKKTRVG